jgi:hypothetical protein
MRFTFALLTLSLLLTGCGRHLSDAEISHKAVGSWIVSGSSGGMEMRSDGSYSVKMASGDLAYEGSWHIEAGFLVATITNWPSRQPQEAPSHTKRYRIISIDEHQMVVRPEGYTNLVTISKT